MEKAEKTRGKYTDYSKNVVYNISLLYVYTNKAVIYYDTRTLSPQIVA